MKIGYSIKLALSNIRKHRRLFVPYMLAGAGLAAIFFIVATLSRDERLGSVRGGVYIQSFMMIGASMTAMLSIVLIFYTNSFLMKQRRREFGIYNILGLEKRHVNAIVFWETTISATVAIVGGCILGALMYKLCVLLICKLVGIPTVFGFYYVTAENFLWVIVFFGITYLVSLIINMIQIAKLKPVELLKSTQFGEKEPRVKWPFLVIGLLSLGGGYYISITTKNPLAAIALFFVAVDLVILGTYFLYIAGSIALLKLLKRNKKFYYNSRHMISVSGLLYRMKQNAVGLASITIMATSVLVMVSSTFCLYSGTKDGLEKRYPKEVQVTSVVYYFDAEGNRIYREIPRDDLIDIIEKSLEDNNAHIIGLDVRTFFDVAYLYDNGVLSMDQEVYNTGSLGANLVEVTYTTQEEYFRLTGIDLGLKAGEIAYYRINSHAMKFDKQISVGEREYSVVKELKEFPLPMTEAIISNCYGVVLSGEEDFQYIFNAQLEAYESPSTYTWDVAFDYASEEDRLKDDATRASYVGYLNSYTDEDGINWRSDWDSRFTTEEEMFSMNGTLFFLGAILTIVFLFATALIIYYKQISEGYDDRDRFQILQKVGMSSEEVKKTIRSQVLLMFFLPLIVAGMHLAAAFPILYRLLGIFFMTNLTLFIGCAIGAFLAFVVIYVIIYILTTRVYYHIVR